MSEILKYGVAFLIYLFFQVFLFTDLVLFQLATPFIFLLFLFMLPVDTPIPLQYVIAFVLGLLVDVLTTPQAIGLHAFSCLLAVGARSRLLPIIGTSQMRHVQELDLKSQNSTWYITFLLPLIFIHHLAYFFLEDFTFQYFFHTLLKVISSTIYTFIICYLLTHLFYKK
ncbi:MAG: hypothetical protein AAF587_10895 [Bacteroidota bacterium]